MNARIAPIEGRAVLNIGRLGGEHLLESAGCRRPAEAVRVMVCGEPFSGNRITLSLLQRLGAAAVVLHGIGDLPRVSETGTALYKLCRDRLEGFSPTHALMPVRSVLFHDMAIAKRGRVEQLTGEARDQQLWDVCRVIADYCIPLKAFSYEAFVADPKAHALWWCRWMGLDVAKAEVMNYGWIRDGNEKYRVESSA